MKTWQEIITEQIEGKTDLKKLYVQLNKELFNNELITNIPFKWTNSARIPGEVVTTVKAVKPKGRLAKLSPTMGEVIKWKFLGISKKFNLDEVSLKGIMAHEMVHVYLLQQGIIWTSGPDSMHGYEFTDKLKQLKARANFPIPEKETDLEPSTDLVARPTGFIWLRQSGKNFIVKASPKFMESNLKKAIDHFLKFFVSFGSVPGETESVEIGIVDTAALETVKGIRKIPFKGWSTMTDEKIRTTLQNKQILFRKVRGT